MGFDMVVVIFHCGNFEVRDVALVGLSGSLKTARSIHQNKSPLLLLLLLP